MREVLPSQLWLGNALDARDVRLIHDMGIRAVVDLAIEEPVPDLTRELVYCRVPITDGSRNTLAVLMHAIEVTSSLIRAGIPTLVTCGAGMSRAPSIVAASLALAHDRPLDDVLRSLTADTPHDVSPVLWIAVKSAYNALVQSWKLRPPRGG